MTSPFINLLIKPTDDCNLRCIYCFHAESNYDQGILSLECLNRLISLIVKKYTSVNIIWHGGEPTLVPLSFYESAYEIFSQYKGIRFNYSIQTNGTLIDTSWVSFLKNTQTSVGLSFDGIDNSYTRKGTKKTLNAMRMLKSAGIPVGAICVLTNRNIFNLIDEYEYFKQLSIGVKFNPFFIQGAAYKVPTLSLSVKNYVDNFNKCFYYWLCDTQCNINVSSFYTLLKLIISNSTDVCTFGGCLGKWLSLDNKGNLFACDRFFGLENALINVQSMNCIDDAFTSENFRRLLLKQLRRLAHCSSKCDIYNMCYGGCTKKNNSSVTEFNFFCKSHNRIVKNNIEVVKKFLHDIDKQYLHSLNPMAVEYIQNLPRKVTRDSQFPSDTDLTAAP